MPRAVSLPLIACALLAQACAPESAPSAPTPFEEHPRGSWVDSRFDQRAGLLGPQERAALGLLDELGYSAGGGSAPERTGVLVLDRARRQPGLDLYCSGHGAEAILMDAQGRLRHSWRHPYEWLEGAPPPRDQHQGAWRRLHLFPDGSLLAIHEGLALVKVDRDSKLVWRRLNGAHHDLDVAADGHVFVLTRAERSEPKLRQQGPIVEDWIEELDQDGAFLRRVSLVRALWNSPWSALLVDAAGRSEDVLHANTLELLRESPQVALAAFRPGRVLVSLREIDTVAVVDLDSESVVWLQAGPWNRQHQPTVLENGRLLVFDNMGWHGYSRVLEFDPHEREIVWQHAGEPPASFFSLFSGSAARLANGNTLVTLSFDGRALEIDARGEVVWEFVSPHRAGREDELVAVLYEVTRIPEESTRGWLD